MDEYPEGRGQPAVPRALVSMKELLSVVQEFFERERNRKKTRP